MNPLLILKCKKNLLLMLLLVSSSAFSMQADSLTITLEDAIATALKNNYEIEIAKNNVEANTLLNNYGVAGGLPLVTAQASNTEQITQVNQKLTDGTEINRNAAAGNNTQASLNAGILLYNGKRVVSTKKRLAELQYQSTELLNSQIQNTIALVMTSYYDVVRQLSYLNTVRTSIQASEKRLEILKVRKEAGMANNADLFQAEIDLNTLNQTFLDQLNVAQVAKTELLRILTLDPKSAVSIKDTIMVDNTLKLDAILDRIAANADVKAADHQIRINELIVRETAALRYPTVRFNTAYNFSRNQTAAGFTLLNRVAGPNAGLTLAIPIYNGSAFKRQQQVAEINTESAKLQRSSIVRDYNAGAVKMYQTFLTSLEQLETQKRNFNLAKQLLDLTLQRFELIQATIIDVREAQRSFEDAGYRMINLNYAAKAAEIELKRLSNTLQ
ncbi:MULTISPECIES: TolC family protein [Dyadobacter]|uniref:TolC family protein n=2 Tax=Dyadobacter chenhuakuii TaxID=2909339 RepID=A0ABY4XSK7_9BACT|nr:MULTISPECIES: TolC family protein [Dyadobacter]MCE7069998.1 TolC family protein [Dyadobacter sp. CY327]MCF2492320.1 TolC family protein [Dyadobacter chenhuakuii]MCF2516964.1 TolC family protein [Dyadobacter sp. CY351]USJ33375.1 TolC family protein [Dyadobacter chenhuakuii]